MILCLLSGVVDVAGSIFSLLGINMCYAFGMMVMTLFLCNTSHRFGEPAVRISAVGRIFTSVSFVLGAMLASWLQGTLLVFDYKIIVYALTIAGVVLATFFWIAGDEVLYGNRELFEEDKADGLKDVGECDEEARAIKASAYCGNDAAGSDGRDRSNGKSVSELLEKVIEEKCDIITEQYHLSPREGEVLVMLARGYSARLIERELVISQNTVKTHVKRIYAKLGIHSRDELSLLIDSVAEIDCY